jgi:hypothetical protein
MKNSVFYNTLVKPFTASRMMVLIGVIVWFSILLVVGSILWGSLYLIDSVGLKEKQGVGIVIEKWHEPAHTTISRVKSENSVIPVTNYHSDAWMVEVKINNKSDDIALDKTDWDSLVIHQEVNCKYKKGRIRNTLYIKSITW